MVHWATVTRQSSRKPKKGSSTSCSARESSSMARVLSSPTSAAMPYSRAAASAKSRPVRSSTPMFHRASAVRTSQNRCFTQRQLSFTAEPNDLRSSMNRGSTRAKKTVSSTTARMPAPYSARMPGFARMTPRIYSGTASWVM